MTKNQKRTLLYALLISTLGMGNLLFAQSQPLPQIPLSPIAQNQVQPDATGAFSLSLAKTPDNIVEVLRGVCGHRFVAQSQNRYIFTVNRNNTPRQCLFQITPQTNQATLSGDRQLAEQVWHMIVAIDRPQPRGWERQLIPYQHTSPDVLIKALDAYQVQRPITPQRQNPAGPIQQVQYQEGGLFDLPAVGIEPPMMMSGTGFMQPGETGVIDLVDNVFKYQLVPELDVIIIEAAGGQLARFTKMIEQLEELSKINRPKVEIVYLKHVNNVSLGQLLDANTPQGILLYNQIFATAQGQVRIIPMTSPNGILLIGWGNAMEVAKEFIEALDLPVAVENSRLHIFKLKHIPALQARNIIQGMYPNPPLNSGFAARIFLWHDPRSNALIVQAAPNDLSEIERTLKEIDVPDSPVVLPVKTFKLKHSLAPDLAATLTQVVAGNTQDGKMPALEMKIQSEEGQRLVRTGIMSDVQISTDARNNVIIVRAPEVCMEFIEELIKILDTANPEASIKVFQIEHGDAESLVLMLKELIPTSVAGEPGPQLPGAANEDTLISMRLTHDARTNSVLAAGSAGDLMVVEALLNSLDQQDILERVTEVYFLKNMRAGPVADTINLFDQNYRTMQAASPGVTTDLALLESAVIVVADTNSNALIISATARRLGKIMELIEELDKSPAQVAINVLIAEVTLSENKEWAAELGFQDPLMFLRGSGLNFNTPTSPPTGTTNPGILGSQMLSNFGTDRGGGGVLFSASSDYLNIMLRALHANNRLEVLSNPNITTMNNKDAVISVGQRVPRARPGTMNSAGTLEYSYEDIPVDLMLTIIPTISPEGTIVMSVILKKDKVGPEVPVGNTRMASIDTSELTTSVSAANNQTVVLGGLITKEDDKAIQKVPLLGDVPLLGKFFRRESTKTTRKELIVILTPRIITSQDEIDRLRQIELARMSWCLKNVVETHGDIGAYSVVSPKPYTGNVPIFTPGPVNRETLQPLHAPTLPMPMLPGRN